MTQKICFPTERISVNSWILKSDLPIGEKSSFAQVFMACKENNCRHAMKIITGKRASQKEIKREVFYQNKIAEFGLCVPVEDWWLCSTGKGGVIISSLLRETLGRTIQSLDMSNFDIFYLMINATKLIYHLHQEGFYHGDSHVNNFMIDNEDQLFFIDMGMTGELRKIYYSDKDEKGREISRTKITIPKYLSRQQARSIKEDYIQLSVTLTDPQYIQFSNKAIRESSKILLELAENFMDKYDKLSKKLGSDIKKGILLEDILDIEKNIIGNNIDDVFENVMMDNLGRDIPNLGTLPKLPDFLKDKEFLEEENDFSFDFPDVPVW